MITCWRPGQERQAQLINDERAMRGLPRLPSCAELAAKVQAAEVRRQRNELFADRALKVAGVGLAVVVVASVVARAREAQAS